jgi:hypothetical protein
MLVLAKMMGVSIQATLGYREWEDAEERFLRDLRKKLSSPDLKAELAEVSKYDAEHGGPDPLYRH